MTIDIFVTQEDHLRWDAAFRLVSLERCVSLLGLSGISLAILEQPCHLIEVARQYLRNRSTRHTNYESSLQHQYSYLVEAFDQIESLYTLELAQFLSRWFLLFIVDDRLASGWFGWRTLFYQFCEPDEDEVPPLPLSLQSRICTVLDLDQHRSLKRSLEQQIELAKTLPHTDWEEWLENEVLYGVGDEYPTISAVETALTEVSLITDAYLTRKTLFTLKRTLCPDEQSDFIEWAYQQAEDIGIPGDLIMLAWATID